MTRELSVLIADDEPLARAGLRTLLADHLDLVICGEARDGEEAANQLLILDPDVVLLDVQMPGADGFEVLRAVPASSKRAVIFVTAYDEFALRAFEAHAIDYVLKPVQRDRLDAALTRARQHCEGVRALQSESVQSLLLAVRREGVELLVVGTGSRASVLNTRDIDWVEADDYCSLVHAAGVTHLMRESLKALEVELGQERFIRVHRRALVNLSRVVELRRSGTHLELKLQDGVWIRVSRKRHRQVQERLGRPR